MRIIILVVGSVLLFLVGYYLGISGKADTIDSGVGKLKRTMTTTIAKVSNLNARQLVLLENPELIGRIMAKESVTQEMLVYLDHMTVVRASMN